MGGGKAREETTVAIYAAVRSSPPRDATCTLDNLASSQLPLVIPIGSSTWEGGEMGGGRAESSS